jgi:hypothetical protein
MGLRVRRVIVLEQQLGGCRSMPSEEPSSCCCGCIMSSLGPL